MAPSAAPATHVNQTRPFGVGGLAVRSIDEADHTDLWTGAITIT